MSECQHVWTTRVNADYDGLLRCTICKAINNDYEVQYVKLEDSEGNGTVHGQLFPSDGTTFDAEERSSDRYYGNDESPGLKTNPYLSDGVGDDG